MNTKYSAEQWQQAYDLVVKAGLSYAEAAEQAGLSLSALQKRAASRDWRADRERHEQTAEEYRRTIFQAKLNAAKKVLSSGDPQDVHALTALERAYPEYRYRKGQEDTPPDQVRDQVLRFLDLVVEYLEQRAPSVLYAFKDHLRPLAEHLLAALGVPA